MTDEEKELQLEMQFVAFVMKQLSVKLLAYDVQHATELKGASEILIEWSEEFFKGEEL